MAKSGFWLNGAKGKLAGATIYTSDGETVMRQIKGSIKNPKTKAQMIQRVIAKTTMSQYAFMKGICDHSFQGLTAGKKCMAKFASLNNKLLRTRAKEAQDAGQTLAEVYNYIPCKSAKYVPASVIISEGELPRIYTTIDVVDASAKTDMTGAVNTYEGVCMHLGLQRGDQLTFVTIEKNEIGNYSFNVCRVILDPRNEDGTAAPMSTTFVENDAIVKPSFRNEGNFNGIAFDDNALLFNIGKNAIAAAGVIASREEDGDWKRSTCVLVTEDTVIGDDLCSLEDAVRISVEGTPIYTDSSRYLNNAGVGGPQSEDAPETIGVSLNSTPYIDVTKGQEVEMMGENVPDLILVKGLENAESVKLKYEDTQHQSHTEILELGAEYEDIWSSEGMQGFLPAILEVNGEDFCTFKASE